MATESPKMVDAVKKTTSILETLKTESGATITGLAETTGISKSTVYRHLLTLFDDGLVVRNGDVYYLSFRFLEFVDAAWQREPGYRLIEPKVEELAEETGELVQFMIEEHNRAICVYRNVGERAVKFGPRLGHPLHLHALAAGKAIISTWSAERVEDFLETEDLPQHTDKTITDTAEFLDELERIRDRGFALNDQESIEGMRAVSVPVMKPNEEALGALTLSGPTYRLGDERFEEVLPKKMLGVANEIELNITYS